MRFTNGKQKYLLDLWHPPERYARSNNFPDIQITEHDQRGRSDRIRYSDRVMHFVPAIFADRGIHDLLKGLKAKYC